MRVNDNHGVIRVLVVAASLLSAALPACSDDALDGLRWACETDHDCGSDATCRLGVCVARGVPTPVGGLVCDVQADEPVRFAVSGAGGEGRVLTFSAQGRTVEYALPAEVESLDAGPLEGCCVNACCALRP